MGTSTEAPVVCLSCKSSHGKKGQVAFTGATVGLCHYFHG